MNKCVQCGKPMNPVDWMIGSTCLKCCQDNQKKANGKK